MLNFVEISHRIENPSKIKLEDLEGLRQLAERFPFTAIFSQLYLKGLALHNTIQFEAELKHHAYKIPDRAQLFYLVHSVEENLKQADTIPDSYLDEEYPDEEMDECPLDSSIDAPVVEEPSEEVDIPVDASEVETPYSEYKEELREVDDTASSEEEEKTSNSSAEEQSNSELETSVKKQNVESAEKVQDNQEEEEKEEKRKANISNRLKNVNDLERDILAHAISSSIFIEIDELEGDTYHFEKFKKIERTEKEREEYDSPSIEFEVPLNGDHEDDFEEEKKEEIKKHSSNQEDERKSFNSWMSSFVEDEKLKKTELKIERKSTDLPRKEQKTFKKPEVKEKNKEILTPEKRKSEFFSPVKKARESLDESRLPVSETLAKVYAAQGNYPKAIDAYHKLLLKFPEKKSFFALQIETLKRKLN